MFPLLNTICSLLCFSLLISALGMFSTAESALAGKAGDDTNPYEMATGLVSLFTEEEQNFLAAQKKITMCVDPDWMPLEKIEKGQHVGMSADYFALIEEKIGLPIVLVPTRNWSESIEFAKARKCDIFSLAMATPERRTYMHFTDPYLSFPLVLATQNDQRFIDDLTSVQDKLLGVVKGYAFGELLRSKYPKMQIVDVASVNEGLKLVAQNKIYGFIGTLATVSSTIQKGFSDELKIVGKFDERWELGVATRNDQPQLLHVFNKAINTIDKAEHQQILNRWISVKYVKSTDYTYVWRILPFVIAGILFLLSRYYTLGKYNKRLKKQNRQILRQAELLKETEKKLLLTQYAVDSCAYPIIWTKNASVLKDTRIIHANKAAATILGYSQQELLSLGIQDIDVNITEDNWLPVKNTYSKQTTHRRKDGSVFPVELYRSCFEYQGQSYCFAFFTDISKQKKMEVELHRSLKMEAVGMMAGGVAHDLNNILSGIVSYPELLLMNLPKDSNLRKPLQLIEDSGKRAAEVVADMLTVARGAAVVREPANLNILIDAYFDSPEYQKLYNHHERVVCKRELAPNLFNIVCSAVHIRKCIMNLVVNAMESLDDHGVITVSTRNVYIDQSVAKNQYMEKGEYVHLVIADTGKGIAEKDLSHIFEPFYTKKAMGKSGTGLGLAIVWNSVQDHDGVITVESDEQGTAFSLYFPATRDDLVEQIENMNLDELMGNGEHILIIDDEVQQIDIASQMLSALGYRISTVNSGEEATKYLKEHRVDLLLLDMIMGAGINGRQTFEQAIGLQAGVKAIVVSGFSENDEVRRAQELGAGQLIRKPYSLNQIGRAVKQELA
jgi:PAS domain S-box-containing protein